EHRSAEQQTRRYDEPAEGPSQMAAVHPTDRGYRGKQEHCRDLGEDGEPEGHGSTRPISAATGPTGIGGRPQDEEHREGEEERDDDVVREHRRPGEVEGKNQDEKRRDDGAGSPPEQLPDGVDDPDTERGTGRDGSDHANLGQAEDPTRESAQREPGDAEG